MEKEKKIIDATGKTLGRLASQIALILRGKDKRDFHPSQDAGKVVVVKNVEKMRITGKKMEKKKYYHHSGYLGGLKEISLKKLFQENPKEILKRAVYGMLPKNRWRKKIIQKLKFE